MTAPLNDTWENIREIFPREHSKHFEILEYIRIHPGCGASEIRAYFDPCDASGLMRVLFQMYKDGDVNMDGDFRFFPKGCWA